MGFTTRGASALLVAITLLGCGDDGGGLPDGATAGCRSETDCDDGVFCNGTETCAEGSCVPGEPVVCDDATECTTDRCDEALGRCVYEPEDADDDGFPSTDCGGDDCDDADPNRYPGNTELCDEGGVDEDCDPTTYGFRDADGDGFPDIRCCNDDNCGNDCDDTLPSAHPGEAESCDGFDNDCDGMVDEGVRETFFADTDGDRFGDPTGESTLACFTPEGFSSNDGDCDDDSAEVRPGAPELCDTAEPPVDENCDGVANPDSLCNCELGESRTCLEGGLAGVCAAGTQSCDMGAWGACSIAATAESCDGEDDDCDGFTDEGLTIQCWADDDGDTFALSGASEEFVCPDPTRPAVGECPVGLTDRSPVGAVDGVVQFECDDADPAIRPDQAETCNGIDDDCDGAVDEMTTITCYADADGDSYPPSGATPSFQCPGLGGGCPAGFTDRMPGAGSNDCDDGDVGISPAVSEVCDGSTDEDCDGAIDEMTSVTCYVDADGDTYSPASATPEVRCADPGTGTCPSGNTTRPPSMGADCDDGAAGVNPVAGESCDGADQDCDGSIDEGQTIACYSDGDGDGFAAAGATPVATCPDGGACPTGTTGTAPSAGTDCDDGDAARTFEIACWTDGDGDGIAEAGATIIPFCGDSCGSGLTDVPPAVEDCNDADPTIAFDLTCYVDADGDGFAAAGAMSDQVCELVCPDGWTAIDPALGQVDCDDTNSDRSPVLNEICDYATDEDCDSKIDEGVLVAGFRDQDGDSWGAASGMFCADDPEYVTRGGDCRDDHADVFPGQLGYFSEPACSRSESICTDGLGRIGCGGTDSDGGGMYCNTDVRAHWDYDCSNDIASLPPSLLFCATSVCESACTGTGANYVADPLTQEYCGRDFQNMFCACDTGGGCSRFQNATTPWVTISCR